MLKNKVIGKHITLKVSKLKHLTILTEHCTLIPSFQKDREYVAKICWLHKHYKTKIGIN